MCKRILSLVVVFALVFAEVAMGQVPPTSRTVRVRKNTALRFALMTPLSSATSKVGDDVSLRLTRDLTVDGITVLTAGGLVHGRVKKVWLSKICQEGAAVWEQSGGVELELSRIRFPDSTKAKSRVFLVAPNADTEVPETYVDSGSEQDDPGAGAYLLLPLAPVFWAAIGVALLVHLGRRSDRSCVPGSEYVLQAGTVVGVRIVRDHVVSVPVVPPAAGPTAPM